MSTTATLIKELARKSKSEPKPMTDALRLWTQTIDMPDTIEVNKKDKYSSLEIDVVLNDQDYTCFLVAVDEQMLMTVSIYIQPPIPRAKLKIVKDWILWRNQYLETGQFQLSSDEKFVLYFHGINFGGADSIDTALIQNLFDGAVQSLQKYLGEYLELIKQYKHFDFKKFKIRSKNL
jgi:hypothetical protein